MRAAHNGRNKFPVSGPQTAAVVVECLDLADKLLDAHLVEDVPDRLVWRWTADGQYSSASAYEAFFCGRAKLAGAVEVWGASAPPKAKFFVWLALHGRPWTAERRHRHGLQSSATCVLCDQEDETIGHLITSCVFSRQVWHLLLSRLGLQHLTPTTQEPFVDWWLRVRVLTPAGKAKVFDSLAILAFWVLWKERNRRTFDAGALAISAHDLTRGFAAEGLEWLVAGFRGIRAWLPLLE